MAISDIKVDIRIYGTWLAKQVGVTFRSLGFSEVECLRAAKACLVMRATVGGHSRWQWGGGWTIEEDN